MGFLGSIIKKIIAEGQERTFTPDFRKSEYDNWLEYVSLGGTTKEWNELKEQNNWFFKESEIEIYQRYQKEVKKSSDMYFYLLQEIQKEWSLLYNQKQYTGARSDAFEKMCLDDITYYKKMREIDIKYGEKTPVNVPAFTRLAMLYEKQEQFEKAAAVCLDALKLGIDESSRLLRMIKKSERLPTEEETLLIEQHLRG